MPRTSQSAWHVIRQAVRMRYLSFFTNIVACLLLLGCQTAPQTSKPSITLLTPPQGSTFAVGERVSVQTSAADPSGITRVELYADEVLVTQDVPPTNAPPQFQVIQFWSAAGAGQHVLIVRAYNSTNVMSEVGVRITVQESVAQNNATPTEITATPLPPTVAPTSAAPATVSTLTPACTPNAQFVAEVTIPDRTLLQPNQQFTKTWRMRNTGNCAWDDAFRFVFVTGTAMTNGVEQAMPPTDSGATVDLAVPMQAPATSGQYVGRWRMRDGNGQFFGTEVAVIINVAGAPTKPPPTAPLADLPPGDGGMTVQTTYVGGELRLEVRAHFGGDNGFNVARVEMFVQDLKGNVIASKTENTMPYCFFGEANGECNTVQVGTNAFRWVNNKPIQPGTYLIRAVAYSRENTIRVEERPVRITIPPDDLETFFVELFAPQEEALVDSQLDFEASVSGQGVDGNTGEGIARVEMFIVKYNGEIVSAQPEQNPNYCGFGDAGVSTPCNVWNFSARGGKWPNGARIARTQYLARVIAYATDGRVVARSHMFQVDSDQ